MNIIKNKTPVIVNISLTQARLERYAFYTPAFISEREYFTDRSVEVFQLSDVIKAGYSQYSSAYIYCALAFAQTERVDSVILVAKKSNETYLEAYKESPINKYYFLSLESQNEDDVLEISDYLLLTDTYKLIFISKYEDISLKLQGRRNIVWIFWFVDSNVQHPESAWISRCGNLFPSHVQWSCKELIGASPRDTLTPQAPFNTPSNWYDVVMDYPVIWGDGTTCNGEWIDSVVFDDWLRWAIQRNVWKLFKNTPKINATDKGIEQIELKIREVLDFGVEQNGIISYKVTEKSYDRLSRSSSFKFNYTRVHAIIGVISINGTINA